MRTMRERVAGVDDLLTVYARRLDDHPEVDPTQYLADLLCDLRHWCGREGIPFGAAWSLGTTNFEAELRGDDEDEPRDLQQQHPELYDMLVRGEYLSEGEWQEINATLDEDDPEPAPLPTTLDPVAPDPPRGIIDNIFRAERMDDLVAECAQRVGLQDDEPYSQIADMLCDIRHWAVAHHMIIATMYPPRASTDAPWQRGAQMWVEEMLGEDVCREEDLQAHLPDVVAAIRHTLDRAPGGVNRAAEISAEDYRRVNRLAYWELNADAPRPEPMEIKPLDHELFG